MAVCLEYQTVYVRRRAYSALNWRVYAVLGLVVLTALGVKVRGRLNTVKLGYELDALQTEAMSLDRQKTDLEYQRSVLLTYDHIRHEATTRLHMRDTDPSQVKIVP